MGIHMNLDGVEPQAGGGMGPLPEGEHVVKIVEAKEVTSSKGTDGIECVMEVAAGEHEGGKIWDTVWITEKTVGMVRWKLECAGVAIPAGDFVLEPRHLVGRRVQIVVRHEPYIDRDGNERTAARVKGWNPAPGAAATSDDPFSGGGGAGTGIPNPKPAGAADDDEIPF